jgi:hypothetical protein
MNLITRTVLLTLALSSTSVFNNRLSCMKKEEIKLPPLSSAIVFNWSYTAKLPPLSSSVICNAGGLSCMEEEEKEDQCQRYADLVLGGDLQRADPNHAPLVFVIKVFSILKANKVYIPYDEFKKIISLLINNDTIDLLQSDDEGDTPLHVAVDNGYLSIVKELLKKIKSENIDIKNKHGETPLSLAACCGDKEVVRELLAAGASPFMCDSIGRVPLSWAAINLALMRNEGVVSVLLAAYDKIISKSSDLSKIVLTQIKIQHVKNAIDDVLSEYAGLPEVKAPILATLRAAISPRR